MLPVDHLAVALLGQQMKPLLEVEPKSTTKPFVPQSHSNILSEQEMQTYLSTFDEQPFRFERDSSLAYRSCCHSVENNDTFYFYIDVISTSTFDKERWNQLFQQWFVLVLIISIPGLKHDSILVGLLELSVITNHVKHQSKIFSKA